MLQDYYLFSTKNNTKVFGILYYKQDFELKTQKKMIFYSIDYRKIIQVNLVFKTENIRY